MTAVATAKKKAGKDNKCQGTIVEPPYSFWAYHQARELRKLNQVLVRRNIAPKIFSIHAGETGSRPEASISHLSTTFLLCNHVMHGIDLRFSPQLLYAYYLNQIPLGITPTSNDALFVRFDEQRKYLKKFVERGIPIFLGTDDPTVIKRLDVAEDALLKEYEVTRDEFGFSPVDLAEFSTNSMRAFWLYWGGQLKGEYSAEMAGTAHHPELMDRLRTRYALLRKNREKVGGDAIGKLMKADAENGAEDGASYLGAFRDLL